MALSCRFLWALIVCTVGFAPCVAYTDISFAALVDRIEALEEQGKLQQAIILEQNKKLVQQEMKIKELIDWKEQQLTGNNTNPPNIMASNQPGIQSDDLGLHDRTEKLNVLSYDLHTNDNSGEADGHAQNQGNENGNTRRMNVGDVDSKRIRNSETHRALLEADGPVAFHAVMNGGDVSIGPSHHIVFNHVNINLGGGYHNLQGLFIAPSSGIYIFSASVLSHGNEDLDCSIIKNGARLANTASVSTSSGGDWDQGSVTIVTQLKAGDEVWVQHYNDGTQTVYGNFYTSFMGCCVVPM